ncbi:MAG: hypothetical protein KC503_45770 [Myxococcales bacterium]|nr:hypothetical protein [Myxococcales bacterium]
MTSKGIVIGFSTLLAFALVLEASPAEAGRCPPGFRRIGRRCVRRATRRTTIRRSTRRVIVRCRPGYHRVGASCVPNRRVGGVVHRRAACGAGFYRNAFGRCVRFRGRVRTCAPGWRWSGYYRRCVRRVTHTCPPGTVWNGYRCRRWTTCPSGYYYSAYYKRCRPRVTNCPYGYRYRPGWGCQRLCPVGWYYSGGRCNKAATTCPAGQFYSYFLKRCRSRCGAGFYWSFRAHRCKPRRW